MIIDTIQEHYQVIMPKGGILVDLETDVVNTFNLDGCTEYWVGGIGLQTSDFQQNSRYQTPQQLPVCDYNHSSPIIVFISPSDNRLT